MLLPDKKDDMVFGKMVGDKIPGESRHIQFINGNKEEAKVSTYNGLRDLKSIF